MPDPEIVLHFQSLGVPTDSRFEEEVRDRARKLALKRPSFYTFVGYALHIATVDQDVFNSVSRWVLYHEGDEPE